MAWLWLFWACGPGSDVDSDTDDTTHPIDTQEEGCTDLAIEVVGSEEPHVGDSWTVWLYCDDALLTGPMVLQFTPPDIASIDVNVATFLEPGDASMHVQVGGFEKDMELTVGE